MSDCLLELRDINKSFGGVRALNDFDIKIYSKEVLCLAGENGCGKSTVIKIISGFYKPDNGQIIIDGKFYSQMNLREAIHVGIQVVYQDFSIFPNLSVYENIAVNTMVVNKKKLAKKKEMKAIAKTALDKLGLQIPLDVMVSDLSVADKQLVAISRAILNNSRIIIFDEPTSALTNKEVQNLFKVIRNLKDQGIAIVFVSHKLDEMFEIGDRVCVMSNGTNVIEDTIDKFDKKKLVYYMTSREYNEESLAQVPEKGDAIFEVRHLSLAGCFNDVSFSVFPKEVLGITGLLGSGRTELAKSIFGLLPHTSGQILLNGKELKIQNAMDGLKNHIAYVPEDRITEALFMSQSIVRNTVIESLRKVKNKGMYSGRMASEYTKEWVKQLSIKVGDITNPVSSLSGGNQQKVVIAKNLMTDPKVLVLNCPTVGVDISAKMDLYQLIQHIAESGVAVILISDDSSEILVNCERFLIIKNGKICEECRSKDYTDSTLYSKLVH